MTFSDSLKKLDEETAEPARPAYSPSREMRTGYLERRRAELDMLIVSARAGEWKPIVAVVNNVRGTGAMFEFPNIGEAAENLLKAVQNGDPDSPALVDVYVKAVNESYV